MSFPGLQGVDLSPSELSAIIAAHPSAVESFLSSHTEFAPFVSALTQGIEPPCPPSPVIFLAKCSSSTDPPTGPTTMATPTISSVLVASLTAVITAPSVPGSPTLNPAESSTASSSSQLLLSSAPPPFPSAENASYSSPTFSATLSSRASTDITTTSGSSIASNVDNAPASTSAPTPSTKSFSTKHRAATIVAAVLAPFLVISLAVAGVLIYKRWRRARDRREWERTHEEIAGAVREAGNQGRGRAGVGLGYPHEKGDHDKGDMDPLVGGRYTPSPAPSF